MVIFESASKLPPRHPTVIHVATQGDCLSSIAARYGFFWETLWNHEENTELRVLRRDPNVLLPGDRVFIPDRISKSVICSTGQVHRFLVKGVPAKLRVQLIGDNGPRIRIPYTLHVDGVLVSQPDAATDDRGFVSASIPPTACVAELRILPEGGTVEEYSLRLGHVDPVATVTGQKQRLHNLGLFRGALDGEMTLEWREALSVFQVARSLPHTGEPDEATLAKLLESHDHT